jgi:putative signal transducing protein
MREVYTSLDSASVGLRQALLKEADIASFVQSENLSRSVNALIGPFQAKLCVEDGDYEDAMEVLQSIKEDGGPDWICSQCKEMVPGSFDSCWKCQAAKPQS